MENKGRGQNAKFKLSLKPRSSIKKTTQWNPFFLFEDINESVGRIITQFLDKHPNQDRVAEFRKSSGETRGCSLLYKVLQEFEDFSFFDLISSSEYLVDEEKKKKFLIERNNFFFRVLISLDEQNFRVDDLVNTFVMRFTESLPELEVDFFFLCFLEYKDKSEAIEIRHNEYFRNLMSVFNNDEAKRFLKGFNPRSYLQRNDDNTSSNISLNEIEVTFVKNVMFSCVRRGFHEGIM